MRVNSRSHNFDREGYQLFTLILPDQGPIGCKVHIVILFTYTYNVIKAVVLTCSCQQFRPLPSTTSINFVTYFSVVLLDQYSICVPSINFE